VVEHHQVDLALLQLLGHGHQVLQGAAEAVHLRDHELVAGPGDEEGPLELDVCSPLSVPISASLRMPMSEAISSAW
jgi:hypothetical protein